MLELDEFCEHIRTIPNKKWIKLFSYIPKIKKEKEYSYVEAKSGNFPYHVYIKDADELIDLIIELDLMPIFNYIESDEIDEILDKNTIHKQEFLTVCKFFTVMIRSERFSDGFIAYWLKEGIVLGLLKRLQELYKLNEIECGLKN